MTATTQLHGQPPETDSDDIECKCDTGEEGNRPIADDQPSTNSPQRDGSDQTIGSQFFVSRSQTWPTDVPSNEEGYGSDEREEPFRQSEARYRQIVEDQTDPVCRFLPDGTLTFVNSAYRRFFSRTDEDYIGRSVFDFISNAHVMEVRARIATLNPAQPVLKCEHEIKMSPSEFRWINWTFRGIFDETDEIVEIQSVARDVTDRKRAELALKKSEERYYNLIKAIPDGVVAYDIQGKATYVNDGFVQLYGWTQEELGQPIPFVPPEEKEKTLAAWGKTFQGEKVLLETKRLTKAGKPLDIQLRTAVLSDRDGNVSESIVIHRDITERKKAQEALQQAHDQLERRVAERTAELAEMNEQLRYEIAERKRVEEKLRESEARYRMLVENAPLGIIWCDLQGKVVQINSNLLAILGSPSSKETETINMLTYPPLVQAGISDQIRQCIVSGGTRIHECPYSSKQVDSAWLRLHMVPTRDNFGRIDGVQAIVEDVTDRKNAQTALAESEERFRAVFETARDLIFMKNRELAFTHINPAFLRSLELQEHEVIGKTSAHIFGAQEADYIQDLENRVLGGQVVEATYNLTTRTLPKTFHCIRVPLRSASGETIGICGIARDITERKALELRFPRSVGRYRSTLMEATLEQTRLAAQSESIVMLLGESGSGKDHLAKYLHDHSRRAGGPFFAINCAALASSLAESELFGHEPGSFTGSRGRKRGLLEMAEGGTLLLNEIGELSTELQAKLLTFLDTQSFTRVGGEKMIQVNARIVGATNRNLEEEVAAGRFRQDLYYRLNVFSIRVPSLRERKDDIPFLARDILETLSMKLGRSMPPVLDVSGLEALAKYDWPGNVRELRNVLERALILSGGDVIRAGDISIQERKSDDLDNAEEIAVSVSLSGKRTLNDALESAKRDMVVGALRRCKGNVSATARLLGISRDALRHHMKMLELDRRPSQT